MTLEELGYNKKVEAFSIEQKLNDFEIGRIIAEHKERFTVKTIQGEYEAEITGNMRFSAVSREDFPAVGDWVALTTYDSDSAIIHKIMVRISHFIETTSSMMVFGLVAGYVLMFKQRINYN